MSPRTVWCWKRGSGVGPDSGPNPTALSTVAGGCSRPLGPLLKFLQQFCGPLAFCRPAPASATFRCRAACCGPGLRIRRSARPPGAGPLPHSGPTVGGDCPAGAVPLRLGCLHWIPCHLTVVPLQCTFRAEWVVVTQHRLSLAVGIMAAMAACITCAESACQWAHTHKAWIMSF